MADNASRQPRYLSGQYFFEYLVVVSLKAKDGSSYEPQITYQFPKVSPWSAVNIRDFTSSETMGWFELFDIRYIVLGLLSMSVVLLS